MPGKLPNFFLAGVPRAGTTSLAGYLAQHPEICLSTVKEPCFFLHPAEYARGLDYYVETFFPQPGSARAIGDASTQYLLDPRVARRIRDDLPETPRFLIVFREPVARAYSFYWWAVRNEIERLSFEQAVESEESRIRELEASGGPWWDRAYVRAGRYATHLAAYLELFPRERFLFLRYEELARPEQVCRRIFDFLCVDPEIEVDTARRLNPAALPRARGVQSWIREDSTLKRAFKAVVPAGARRGIKRAVESVNLEPIDYPPLAPATRRTLAALYRPEIVELERITGLDLATWLQDDDGSA